MNGFYKVLDLLIISACVVAMVGLVINLVLLFV